MGIDSPGEDAFMEWPGIDVGGINDPHVRRAFQTINEFFRRGGVVADQDAKQTGIDLNATHRTGNGADHADVASNNAHRTGNGAPDHADVVNNNSHRIGTGNSHSWLNQDVTKGAAVQFAGLKFGAGGQQVTSIDADTSLGMSNSKLATQGAIKSYIDTQIATRLENDEEQLRILSESLPESVSSVDLDQIYREVGGDVKWRVI